MVGDDPDERSLEHADVVGDPVGDHLEHGVVGDRDPVEQYPLAEDRDASSVVGRLDRGHEARLEPFAQALLNRDQLAGEPVAREHELSPGLVQGVERMEELLLGLCLAGEELDVVDEQDVGIAVGLLEARRPSAIPGP